MNTFKKAVAFSLAMMFVISQNELLSVKAEEIQQVNFSQNEEIKITNVATERNNNLNENWKFYEGDSPEAKNPNFSDSNWETINLPHDFSITKNFSTKGEAESGFLLGGTGWYRKSFSLPENLSNKKFTLNFDGVYKDTYVYVNGKYIGENHYGYSPFAFDITSELICDNVTENVIAIKVEHELPSSRWYSGTGIYRDVSLIITNKLHVAVDGTEVTTPNIQVGEGKVKYKLDLINSTEKDEDVVVRSTIYHNGANVATTNQPIKIFKNEQKTFEIDNINVDSPKLWDIDSPNIYILKTELLVGNEVLDTYETKFGFRYFNFDDNTGFSLNGRNIKLNGMCMHHDLGALGSATYYDAMHRQLKIMKDMGANAIRITHNPADKRYSEICNELGLLVIEELFDGWDSPKNGNTKDFSEYFNMTIKPDNKVLNAEKDGIYKTWAEFVLKQTIRRDRNNPSIILWSLGNEIQEGAQSSKNFPQIAPNLIRWVKEEDSVRQVTNGDNSKASNGNVIPVLQAIKTSGGIVGFNYANGGQLDSLKNTYGCFISSETSSHINSRGIYREYTSYGDIKSRHGVDGKYHLTSYDTSKVGWGKTSSESMYDTLTRDYVAGEFVWTGFDYIGEPTPWWAGLSSGAADHGQPTYPNSSYFGTVETTGFPKDSYYLYRSQWKRDGKTCHLVTAWDEGNMEKDTNGKTPVVLYSDAKKIEIYRNDVKVGEAERDDKTTTAGHKYHFYKTKSLDSNICETTTGTGYNGLFAKFSIKFESGRIYAKAYGEDGNLLSDTYGNSSISTPVGNNKIKLSTDKSLLTDNKSLAFVTIDVTDEQGNLDTKATDEISLSISGAGKIAGVDNGDQATEKKYQNSLVLSSDKKTANISTFSGKALVIIRPTKEGGEIKLSATSTNLKSDEINISVPTSGGMLKDKPVSYFISKHVYVLKGTENVTLPEKTLVKYSNGAVVEQPILWEQYDKSLLNKNGDFGVLGKIGDITTRITIHVHGKVVAVKNYVGITKPLVIPELPKKTASYTDDGKIFIEADVEWDISKFTGGDFNEINKVVVIDGIARVMNKEFPVTASIRVAGPEAGKIINITSQVSELKQTLGNPSDNLNSITDGVKYNEQHNASGRWTNWGERNLATNPVINMTWATGQLVDGINLYYYIENHGGSQAPTFVKIEFANNSTAFTGVNYTKTSIPNVSSTDPKERTENGYRFQFDKPVTLTELKITLGHDSGKFIGLSEMEVISKEVIYKKNKVAELSYLSIDGKEIELEKGNFFYETEADKRDKYIVKGSENVAIDVVPVSYNRLNIVVTAEGGQTAIYRIIFPNISKGGHNTEGIGGISGNFGTGNISSGIISPKEIQQNENVVEQKEKKEDLEAIIKKTLKNISKKAKVLSNINVKLQNVEYIPKLLLHEISKSKTDLELHSDKYLWKLKGSSITDEKLKKVELDKIVLIAKSLKPDEQKKIKKLLKKKQNKKTYKILEYVEIVNDATMFDTELVCKVGKKFAGSTAFLTFVDRKNKKIKTDCYGIVGTDGKVSFNKPFMSGYAIITLKNLNKPKVKKTITVKQGEKANIFKYIKNRLRDDIVNFKCASKKIIKINKVGKLMAKKKGITGLTIKYRQGGKLYKFKVKIKVIK